MEEMKPREDFVLKMDICREALMTEAANFLHQAQRARESSSLSAVEKARLYGVERDLMAEVKKIEHWMRTMVDTHSAK